MMFPSAAEVLLSYLVGFHSERSKECSTGDKLRMKMVPGDKVAFPICQSWTAGDPGSCSLTSARALSPDSPAIHYQDVWRAHQTTSGAVWCHISDTLRRLMFR